MGIVAFCPQGHRVKVKDQLAGKKGICPTCNARFRIPAAAVEQAASGVAPATLPEARVVSLDAAVAERLPRALLLSQPPAAAPAHVPAARHPEPEGAVDEPDAFVIEDPEPLAPAVAERPDLVWCVAVPGGTASEPMGAEAMQGWLESRLATGDELVWRADWTEWRPIGSVFPEYLPGGRR